jgi:hypothetical protein
MGIALGWLVRGAPKPGMASELVEVQGNRLVAGSALQAALQSLPSGGETVTSSGGQVYRLSMRMTFQDQSGEYCRQYQIVTARPARHSGIACGKGGNGRSKSSLFCRPFPSRRAASSRPMAARTRQWTR